MSNIDSFIRSYSNRLFKYGGSPVVDTDKSVLWSGGGAYNGFIDTPEQISVVSDSIDDQEGGGGAIFCRLSGTIFDAERGYNVRGSEVVILQGTTPVITQSLFKSVTRMDITAGQDVVASEDPSPFTGPNHGTITASKTSNADVCAIILPTIGKTLMCIYELADDEYGEFENINIYPEDNSGLFTTNSLLVEIKAQLRGSQSWTTEGKLTFGSGRQAFRDFKLPRFVFPGSRIIFVAQITGGASIECYADFEIEFKKFPVDHV